MSKDDDKLPKLTEKQYNYVLARRKGRCKSDAYRDAYDTAKMSERTIWAEASRLEVHPKVSAWLAYSKRESINRLVDESSYTLKAHMAELNEIIEAAKERGSYGPALNGVIAKGKACNHYTEHKEINVNNAADLALLEKLEEILGQDAMLSAAKQMGYSPEEIKH